MKVTCGVGDNGGVGDDGTVKGSSAVNVDAEGITVDKHVVDSGAKGVTGVPTAVLYGGGDQEGSNIWPWCVEVCSDIRGSTSGANWDV